MSPSNRAAPATSVRSDPSRAARRVLAAERVFGPIRLYARRFLWNAAFHASLPDAMVHLAPVLAGRRVALVGNATSLLANPHPEIDDYDVVIRINRGPFVAEAAGTIGARTDIVLVSGERMAIAVRRDLGLLRAPPQRIVFMSTERRSLPRTLCEDLLFYPLARREALEATLGSSPSSGAAGIDLVTALLGAGELHLYGFDFWRTATTYNERLKVGPHSPTAEEAFARRHVPDAHIH